MIETLQLVVASSVEIPETVSLPPTGICCSLVGDVILIAKVVGVAVVVVVAAAFASGVVVPLGLVIDD